MTLLLPPLALPIANAILSVGGLADVRSYLSWDFRVFSIEPLQDRNGSPTPALSHRRYPSPRNWNLMCSQPPSTFLSPFDPING